MVFEQVLESLTGNDDFPPALDGLQQCYVEKKRLMLDGLLWRSRSSHGELVNSTFRLYEKLPIQLQYRILLSPEIHYALHGHNMETTERLESLEALLQVEVEYAEDPSAYRRIEIKHFSFADSLRWASMARFAIGTDGGNKVVYVAPTIDDDLVVDSLSPWARRFDKTSAVLSTAATFVPSESLTFVKQHTEDSIASLECFAPSLARLVRNYARVIRVRSSDDEHICSETQNTEVGAIRFLNPDRFSSLARFRESLVHESVHHFLTTLEDVDGEFVVRKGNHNHRPVSFWSGNPLDIKSFCHAVFVWYTLFCMTTLELQRMDLSASDRLEAVKNRARYARGFLQNARLSSVIPESSVLKPGVLAAFDLLQQNVLAKAH